MKTLLFLKTWSQIMILLLIQFLVSYLCKYIFIFFLISIWIWPLIKVWKEMWPVLFKRSLNPVGSTRTIVKGSLVCPALQAMIYLRDRPCIGSLGSRGFIQPPSITESLFLLCSSVPRNVFVGSHTFTRWVSYDCRLPRTVTVLRAQRANGSAHRYLL